MTGAWLARRRSWVRPRRHGAPFRRHRRSPLVSAGMRARPMYERLSESPPFRPRTSGEWGLTRSGAVAFALGEVPPVPRATRTVSGPADLTPRQEEVASLVAGGLSNREIAASLVISARTV